MIAAMIDSFFSMLYRNDKKGHIVNYPVDTMLIKEGHIPLMAYRVIEGGVKVFDGNKFIAEFGGHTCWGMNEIMNDTPSRYTVWVKKNSKVCTIGKSELHKTWMKMLHLFECDMLEKLMEQNTGHQ